MLQAGARGPETALLCGFCRFDEDIDHPLIARLPGLIVLRPSQLGQAPWLLSSLRLLGLEADLAGQGRDGILTRLVEIIFMQAVRLGATGEGELAGGYLPALADPQLFRALLAVHTRWAEPWTLSGLAREAGMSRAAFARRFMNSVGMAPIAYLTHWRLLKARRLLAESGLAMDEVAARCGYGSAAAFTRRFKAAFGTGPGRFRRSRQSPQRPSDMA